MSHDAEYDATMVQMLELIWGDGYMAPGGAGNVANLLDGTDPDGKRILDIGCGIGGPAMEMARTHGATVTGIDLEAPLVERAIADANRVGLSDRCEFQTVEPGPLPFDDEAFDIVISSGAVTQTPDKVALFAEIGRVLQPGGHFRCYEWFKSPGPLSDAMQYWIEVEGLTYVLCTLEELADAIRDAGFSDVKCIDASGWYRREARREYESIRGDLYDTLINNLGRESADHFVENWRAMVVVCDAGEMLQGYCRGRRPDA